MRDWKLSKREFDALVEEALRDLPENFLHLIDNVAIVVEEEPWEDDYDEAEVDDEYELLGIFRGIPLTEAAHDMIAPLPNQVALFRGPILRCSDSREEAMQQIRETVIHELGHYFGLSDEAMPY